jgi:hypothetical protein
MLQRPQQDSYVDLAAPHLLNVRLGGSRVRRDLNPRKAPLVLAHDAFRQAGGHRPEVAQAQVAAGSFRKGASDVGGMVGLLKDRHCLGKKCQALGCQTHTSSVAFQKLEAELAFQAVNLLAQCWLRDEEMLSGAREVELGGDRHEIAQMP